MELFETRMGHEFFEGTMKSIAKNLGRIADSLESIKIQNTKAEDNASNDTLTGSELLYELYKQDWISRHITDDRLFNAQRAYADYVAECILNGEGFEFESYDDFIEEEGFDGELYACYDEFMDNEFEDEEYRKYLLGTAECLEELVSKELE